MCVTYPGQVLEIVGDAAVVEVDGRRRRALLMVVPETAVGDWVIVSAGAVLRIIEPDEAREIRELLDEAGMTGTT